MHLLCALVRTCILHLADPQPCAACPLHLVVCPCPAHLCAPHVLHTCCVRPISCARAVRTNSILPAHQPARPCTSLCTLLCPSFSHDINPHTCCCACPAMPTCSAMQSTHMHATMHVLLCPRSHMLSCVINSHACCCAHLASPHHELCLAVHASAWLVHLVACVFGLCVLLCAPNDQHLCGLRTQCCTPKGQRVHPLVACLLAPITCMCLCQSPCMLAGLLSSYPITRSN